MGTINVEDKSGQPRSDEDIKEAIGVLKQEFIAFNKLSPQMMLIVPTAIEGLKELLFIRQLIASRKERR